MTTRKFKVGDVVFTRNHIGGDRYVVAELTTGFRGTPRLRVKRQKNGSRLYGDYPETLFNLATPIDKPDLKDVCVKAGVIYNGDIK